MLLAGDVSPFDEWCSGGGIVVVIVVLVIMVQIHMLHRPREEGIKEAWPAVENRVMCRAPCHQFINSLTSVGA